MSPALLGLTCALLIRAGHTAIGGALIVLFLVWELLCRLQYTNTSLGFWLHAARRAVARKLGRR